MSEETKKTPEKNQAEKKKTVHETEFSKEPSKTTTNKTKLPPNFKVKRFEVNINVNKFLNKGLIYLIIGLLFLPFIINLFFGNSANRITLSQLVADIREEKVEKLQVAGSELRVFYKNSDKKYARKEEGQEALAILDSAGIDLSQVNLEIEDVSIGQLIWELLINFLPVIFTVIFFIFILRQAKGGQDGIFGFGKSKAKIFIKGKQSIKFKDVGGMKEAKQELKEIVDFLKHPKKYTKVGARTPKGVLLVGPSGTGKTLLARAVAGEADVQFLSIAGSEFMEMLVGVGASRARDLFATAKKLAPSIIFIDEIDAIGRMRGKGFSGGHDEREQTLNQILVEMDGFTQNDNVIVMAATNRGDLLDPALVRPGRFDRRVTLSLPDLEERKNIIKIHAKDKPFEETVNMEKVAKSTVGFSGADIENMLNESAITIARENREKITMNDLDEAGLKVKLGPSKKRLQDVEEREMTAYHEAGHAVLSHVLPNTDRVHRISIISRGLALGFTFTPPEKDKLQVTKSQLMDEIAMMLGGRAAEEIVYSEQTAGASNDIMRATKMARAMVVDYGMSKLGPMNFGPQFETDDYSQAYYEPNKIGNNLQEKVDSEISVIITQAQKRASKILLEHKQKLDEVAKKILEVETLDGDEFEKIMGMKKEKPKYKKK